MPIEHRQRRLALGKAVGLGHLHIHRKPLAVIHQHVAHVVELGALVLSLAKQLRLRVRRGDMGLVRALLPVPVDPGVSSRARRPVRAVASAHALDRRPGLDQRAIDAEVLVREQLRLVGLAHHAPQQLSGHLRLDQPVAVLGEARVIPDRLIDRQPHEPAKQQVVIQLLAQQPLASDRVQNLQRRGSHQPLRRDRGAAFTGVDPIKVPAHARQRLIQQRLDAAQRMCRRHTRLKGHIAEHSALLNIIPAHQFRLGCSVPATVPDAWHFSTAC